MNESRNKVERAIEKRLTEATSNEKPPIGPELAQYLAEWGQWQGNRIFLTTRDSKTTRPQAEGAAGRRLYSTFIFALCFLVPV